MKKQILKTIVTVGLLYSSKLLADTIAPTPQEYKEIVDSFKLIDTSKKELSQTFKINESKIKVGLKKEIENNNYLMPIIWQLNPNKTFLEEPNYLLSIDKYDNKTLCAICLSKDEAIVIAFITRYSFFNKIQKNVGYAGFTAKIKINPNEEIHSTREFSSRFLIDGGLKNDNQQAYTSIPTYNPKEFYPYFNEQRILARLYETGTCDKEATQKANIEVLVGDKWIPQEQSWNVKEEKVVNTNQSSKNPLLTLNQLLENAKTNQKVSLENINDVLKKQELSTKTLQKYNDIAYYLQQANANDEAIFLLEKIIEKFPNRTVAYLNLADAYDGINDKEKAKVNYEKYIELMKKSGKEAKIPKRVLEFK